MANTGGDYSEDEARAALDAGWHLVHNGQVVSNIAQFRKLQNPNAENIVNEPEPVKVKEPEVISSEENKSEPLPRNETKTEGEVSKETKPEEAKTTNTLRMPTP